MKGMRVLRWTGRQVASALVVLVTPGDLPQVTWSRQLDIDPRVRRFTLTFNRTDFK